MAVQEIDVNLDSGGGDVVGPASGGLALSLLTSAAAATTNAFETRWRAFIAQHDASADEETSFAFPVPTNYASGGTLVLQWYCDATSGCVLWKGSAYVATPESSDIDTNSAFNTVEQFALENAPSTAGVMKTSALALTGLSLAANRWVVVMLGRDTDDSRDTAAGDGYIVSVRFAYTTT